MVSAFSAECFSWTRRTPFGKQAVLLWRKGAHNFQQMSYVTLLCSGCCIRITVVAAAVFVLMFLTGVIFRIRPFEGLRSVPTSNSVKGVDPCKYAVPTKVPPTFFDREARYEDGKSFRNDSDNVGNAGGRRTFFTINADCLYSGDQNSVQMLGHTDLELGYDAEVNQAIAESTLRSFYDKQSLTLKPIDIQHAHIDRHRVQFVLHTRVHDFHSDSRSQPRSNRVLLERTFDNKCYVAVIPEASDEERPQMSIVVAYSGTGYGRPLAMSRFITQVKVLALHPLLEKQTLNVIICLHDMTEKRFREEFGLVDEFLHANVDIVSQPVVKNLSRIPFSRGCTIRSGLFRSYANDDTLLFLTTIDTILYPSFVASCRGNAIRGSQVYFPVMYHLYPGKASISPDAGFWNSNSTKSACLYKSDFDELQPWPQSLHVASAEYTGFEREDADLLEVVSRRLDKYRVFRSVEPFARKSWHMKR